MDPKKLLNDILGMREEHKQVKALADKARERQEREVYMPLFTRVTEGTLPYATGIETIAAFAEIKNLIADRCNDLGPAGANVLLETLCEFLPRFRTDIQFLCEKFKLTEE